MLTRIIHTVPTTRADRQCISVSAAMTMPNVVNPTFKEEERALR